MSDEHKIEPGALSDADQAEKRRARLRFSTEESLEELQEIATGDSAEANGAALALVGAASRATRICIATGESAPTLDTTEKIKGIPGGLAQGTNLISFDKSSFCSFGLEQAQNAPLAPIAELRIRTALNTLVQHSREQNLVYNGTIYLQWTREPIAFDPLALLTTADPDGVAHLLQSIRSGEGQIGLDANAYYCLGLSGNGARIVVRDWLETTVGHVEKSIAAWFDGSEIIDPDGVSLRTGHKFGAILYAMVRAELDELPPQLPAALFYAIIRGATVPLPRTALASAIRRQSLDQRKAEDRSELGRTPDVPDVIRGIEGRAAALHFELFARHLRPALRASFPFDGRSRRPPRDAVNALLSFLYALLRHDCVSALTAVGLDPFVGFLHADRAGRESLALDLMEEFRPWVERLGLTLLNRGELKPAQFVVRDGGAVELTESARKTLVAAYQQRKQEGAVHPLFLEKVRHGQLVFIQAKLLARALRSNVDYPPHLFA